eukprot:314675_1
MSSNAQSEASLQASKSSEKYSGSSIFSFAGLTASVSASYSHSASETSSLSISPLFETLTETLDCAGEVDTASKCGDMSATHYEPALVGYRLKPIWSLPRFNKYSMSKQRLIDVIEKINSSAHSCMEGCSFGICGIDDAFWNLKKYQQSDYNSTLSMLWNANSCFEQYQFGTSIIKSGVNVTNHITQCDTTDAFNWGNNRQEITQIDYHPFCYDNVQVAMGLTMINRSISFRSTSSNIKNNGFHLTHKLLSN